MALSAKSFFNLIRELVLGLGVAILIPLIAHYVAVTIQPLSFVTVESFHEDVKRLQKLEDEYRRLEDAAANLRSKAARDASARKALREIEEDLQKVKAEHESLKQSFMKKREETLEKGSMIKLAYAKNYFYVSTAFGLVSLIIGALIPIASLGIGFVIGGFVCLTLGYVTYWEQIHNIIKLISLILALIIVVGMSYRFVRRRED